MRLVLLGPPGAGKGTQAKVLSQRLGIPAVSTGDIFRSNVAGGTSLGREAQTYMDRGDYVPDSVTNAMVRERLAELDCAGGFLLDGYPRTIAQVDELDRMLSAAGTKLDWVVELTVDHDEVVARLLRRGSEQGRTDDGESVVRRRLEIYTEETAPLAKLYAERGLLVQVSGAGDVDDVTGRLVAAVT